jgi:hypothetical protein
VVYVINKHDLSKILSKDAKVQKAVKSQAQKIYRRASSYLALHRDTGAASIELSRIRNEKYGHIDWFVSLVDEAALSIEFGHYLITDSGKLKRVPGLYILTQAYLNA